MSRPTDDDIDTVLEVAADEARRFLQALPDSPALPRGAREHAATFGGPLTDSGVGAEAALRELAAAAHASATRSAGPRFFHFVTGGVTPAALGADWLASALDQNALNKISSPLAVTIEETAIAWLLDLFRLPPSWGGVLTTGATMANFTALAVARHWWADQHGVNVEESGLSGTPRIPVLTSGYIHASALKALSMLGVGRESVTMLARDTVGRLDLQRLEAELERLDGAPAIVIGNAGEVNAGDSDPIADMVELTAQHGCWLHVDAAFGLFGRLDEAAAPQFDGVERADSVIADGHKWLNVPYDCGFAFVRRPELLEATFSTPAAYLGDREAVWPDFGSMGPEVSRRARAIAVWATLRSYGRSGYADIVSSCLEHARHLASRLEAEPDFELLAPVPLNIVCFRYRPLKASEGDLDELNRELGRLVVSDGTVYAGTTVYGGRVALRPALVNWQTSRTDVDLFVDTVVTLARTHLTPP